MLQSTRAREVRLGEYFKGLQKGSGGDRKSDKFKNDTVVDFDKPIKESRIHDLGFNVKQAERMEALADNRDIVERVKAPAW